MRTLMAIQAKGLLGRLNQLIDVGEMLQRYTSHAIGENGGGRPSEDGSETVEE
jgi:hypothetical protein